MKKNIKRLLFSCAFVAPLIMFYIIPLLLSLGISFTDWDYISPTFNIVGLDNYIDLLTDSDFAKAGINTIVFGLGTIIPTLMIGLGLALILKKNFRGLNFYRMVIFSPWVTPTVAVSLVWSWIYQPDDGFLNYFLSFLGIEPLQWLHSSDTAMLGVIIFTIWKSIGWTMLFYITALESVPEENYEAAQLDGANAFNQFIHITLPLISPTTYFLLIINMIQSLQAYDQIHIMTQGGPGGSTTTLLYLYYDKAFQNFQMGSANAVAMVILIVTVILTLISRHFSKTNVNYD